ncbi:hypothetical protein QN372_00285 [Undibacterium sp. RTI2.1]|uniref:hypothetical protein n=1 Tax=unclassified Undibacterium TaxID=2630295 RepID=UPI002AB55031|nr:MULTISPECIES: hypothetical protein [unclassified Undibacterium]MDY7537576.1 hypothetical protein [Undibacterium sp. 5I1]MEB0029176.1 hypothetical protein [Undibacterium sp. RTI2.1]MEB0115484.1 hypothetical protein [Undibacterium sp. RTI2.2]MEB0231961.1 hypothetical protein [Undibacterium sp. 10I3]MEB0256312.1 hypothetical protein [Undibacterium sp. 5I1]
MIEITLEDYGYPQSLEEENVIRLMVNVVPRIGETITLHRDLITDYWMAGGQELENCRADIFMPENNAHFTVDYITHDFDKTGKQRILLGVEIESGETE